MLQVFRAYLRRQLGPEDAKDASQEAFLMVWEAIRRGAIDNPDCLLGFLRTIVHREAARWIGRKARARRCCDCEDVVLRDSSPNPEQAAMRGEAVALAHRVLAGLMPQDREIMLRAYVHDQSNAKIKKELCLTETKFRNAKHRAKSQLANRFSRATRSFRAEPKMVESSGVPAALPW